MLVLEKALEELPFVDKNTIAKRQSAWQAFNAAGFPSKKSEAWRYTDLNALYQKYNIKTIKLSHNKNAAEFMSLLNLYPGTYYNIVFIDGTLIYFDQVEGLVIENILTKESKLNLDAEDAINAIDLLNMSSTIAGVYIEVKQDIKLIKPILITYAHSDGSAGMLLNYHNHIKVGKSAQCFIREHYITFSHVLTAINVKTQLDLAEDVHYTYDVLANITMQRLLITNSIFVKLYKNSYYETFQLSSQSALNRVDFNVDLLEEGAVFNAKGIYTLAQSARADYHFYVNHLASNTQSDVSFRGVVGGKASATFNAKAYVNKGLHGIKAFQNNRNIQLSNSAEINTKPELEIYSDDVICSHGATIGYLDNQALFYLKSRGIPNNDAMTLLIEGFAKELITLLDRDEATLQDYIDNFEGHIKNLL
ncbi:SufB/SufD family protein [Fastidiosibacter lacustris]|uniref:SufB/SufD family protein n=1 Tax=Fastidiosibacter lacustris TaxID=2056695 RepID=UPI000E35492C|nr:SufD family Fe-S cluster assembly protein [Fastidiosibacter lacustris]